MTFDFSGKRVIVAGGSRGIGRAIALRFAAAGAGVAICARGARPLEATQAEIAAHGRRAHAAPCDVADARRRSRAYVAAAAERSAASTCWSTTPRASAWATTRRLGGRLPVDVMAMVRATQRRAARMQRSAAAGGADRQHLVDLRLPASTAGAGLRRRQGGDDQLHGSQAAMLARARASASTAIAPGSIEFPGGVWEAAQTAGPAL